MSFLKEKIVFGIDPRKKLNGSDLYVKTFQIMSMLPVVFVAVASGDLKLYSSGGPLAWLFELGTSALPRLEMLGLSFILRETSSEVIMTFVMLAIGLILGLLSNKIFREDDKRGVAARKVFMALIAIDLIVRLLPLEFNRTFGLPVMAAGFIIRAACIAALYLDIKAYQANNAK